MTASRGTKDGRGQLTSRADGITSRVPDRTGSRGTTGVRGFGTGPRRALVKTNRTDGNLLDCAILAQDGSELGTVVVARPLDLQAAYYLTQPLAGATYAFVDEDTRTVSGGAGPTETHKVTPDYIEDASIINITKLLGGTGQTDPLNGDAIVVWQAEDGRRWAVV